MDYFVAPDAYPADDFVLRRYRPEDGPLLYEAVVASRQFLQPWMPWANDEFSLELAVRRAREFCGRWLLATDFVTAIVAPDQSRLLGSCGYHLRGNPLGNLTAECGMWIRHDCAGRGLGTAALEALLRWGFRDWPWERIEWRCDDRNVASWRTAEKAGMTLEGTLRHFRLSPDLEPRTSRIYATIRAA